MIKSISEVEGGDGYDLSGVTTGNGIGGIQADQARARGPGLMVEKPVLSTSQ